MGVHPRIGLLAASVFDGRTRKAKHSKAEPSDIRFFLPEMKLMAKITELPAPTLPAEEWGLPELMDLARTIARAAPTHDGFIVIHPWRSMTMTATFLAMALSGLKKPMAFMGPHPSMEEIGFVSRRAPTIGSFGSRAYFINVMQVVIYGYRDALIIDGSRVHRAVRTTTATLGSVFSLEPFGLDAIGNIDVGFSIEAKEPTERKAPVVRSTPVIATWAPVVPHAPFMLPSDADGLFVDCSIAADLRRDVQEAIRERVLPLLWYGRSSVSSSVGIVAPPTTREVAFSKFALAVGAGSSRAALEQLMKENWRGEL